MLTKAETLTKRFWAQLRAIFVLSAIGMGLLVFAVTPQQTVAQEAAVSLSPNTIIELLRKEPGLLLQAKKALLKAASDEGRLLDPKELSDESVYDLVRKDEDARARITKEIEERHYVQAKPTRSELEGGMVLTSGRPANETGAKGGENRPAASQEEAYWESHERTHEYRPEQPAPAAAQAPAPQWILPPPGYAPSQGGILSPDRKGRQQQNETDSRRRLESAQGEPHGNPYFESLPGGQSPRIESEEMAGLVSASLADKPMDGTGKSGFSSNAEGSAFGPMDSQNDGQGLSFSDLPGNGASGSQGLEEARNDNTTERLMPPPALPPAAAAEPKPHYRKNPYADVPSLYDLYTQYPGNGAPLKRFGEEVFRNGTGNFGELPMDLPVGPEYVLGPGDGVSIELFGGISQRLQRVVDRTGRVALPEVGAIEVSGRSLGEVQRVVQSVLRTQFRDVQADVSLSRLRTVRVYVVGDVERPGATT